MINLSGRQQNYSKGVNQKKFIVLHHTGIIGDGNIPILLGETSSEVSAHYLIRQDGSVYKLGTDNMILWHAGVSEWDGYRNLNQYSIGIEVEGPNFTKSQRRALRPLVRSLMTIYSIPKSNVIRHRDIAPGRKIDPDNSLFGLSGFYLWRAIL